ncbi:hypothetical protein GCM10009547_29000 [Sporichthya brevicatena]|uniref:Secreted protein n=1 Tax=Sporichthya brevicatena TaxID=171442 RepID=A0ABN1GZ05_9ACTN
MPTVRRQLIALFGTGALLGAAALQFLTSAPTAAASVTVVTSSVTASDGQVVTATNHLVQDTPAIAAAKQKFIERALSGQDPATKHLVGSDGSIRHEYLVVWAGDANALDNTTATLPETPLDVDTKGVPDWVRDNSSAPDFLAVIDVTRGSPTYGAVVNTVTTGPFVGNEPHHMQYMWHKGDRIYTGSLFTDMTYVFDVTKLPLIEITGVNLPTDTPCGSVPDAYVTLKDGTAYGTYMGGANLPGPCKYTNGEVRVSNGFGGSPGSLVRVGPHGNTLSEVPAAVLGPEGPCNSYPELPTATCANPHGIQAREDLNRLITADYAEPRNIILDPVTAPDPYIFRDTVRIWDITDRNNAKIVSVSHLPDGPRNPRDPMHNEPRGVMEVGVTHLPQHKGAFASSSCGGVIYYTPDITAKQPVWREVWDVTASTLHHAPQYRGDGGCSGASWVQVSLDDNYLFHIVIGAGPGSPLPRSTEDKQVYVLDIRKLLKAGTDTTCSIDNYDEVVRGGVEPDCPTLSDTFRVDDRSSGGPHWGAMDNFALGSDGFYRETTNVKRIAFANSFVARTTVDGNHDLCLLNFRKGKLSLDEDFIDEHEGTPCVKFDRTAWPHGAFGDAKPHAMVFAVPDEYVR